MSPTLSGKTYVKLLQQAREQGYRLILHYVMIDSASQAVERVKHFMADYLPLADEWGAVGECCAASGADR